MLDLFHLRTFQKQDFLTTLSVPKTNSSPLKAGQNPKERIVFQASFFRGENVSFRVYSSTLILDFFLNQPKVVSTHLWNTPRKNHYQQALSRDSFHSWVRGLPNGCACDIGVWHVTFLESRFWPNGIIFHQPRFP